MIGHGHSRDFPIITFPPFCAPPVSGAPYGTERSYRHKQPVGRPMGCCYMPCARCTPRSGAGGRTSHTAPTGPLAPLNDVTQRGHMRYRCPVRGDLSKRRRRSGEVLKQGRAAMPHHIGANVPRLAKRSPKPLGWVRFPTVPAKRGVPLP